MQNKNLKNLLKKVNGETNKLTYQKPELIILNDEFSNNIKGGGGGGPIGPPAPSCTCKGCGTNNGSCASKSNCGINMCTIKYF